MSDELMLAPRITVAAPADGMPTPALLKTAWAAWLQRKPRFLSLYDYYVGHQDRRADLDHLRTANYCRYIVEVMAGYLAGNPPQYLARDGDLPGKKVIDEMTLQRLPQQDIRLIRDMSIYGRAFQLVYHNERMEPRCAVYRPTDAFVVYDDTVEHDSVFGAVIHSHLDDNAQTVWELECYDRRYISCWELPGGEASDWVPAAGKPIKLHGFDRVPLIEYANDDDYLSDFEGIMGLQDAYNDLVTDRVDDKDAFTETMLLLSGMAIGDTEDSVRTNRVRLFRQKVLQMDEGGKAEYLTHTFDEAGIQVLQDCLRRDIHKFAMVPDLSDESFAGAQSSLALAYKMFGTDQKAATKEALFQLGFLRRCKLYDFALNNTAAVLASPEAYTPKADLSGMAVAFRPNVPQDVQYLANSLTSLVSAGILSKQTARQQVPFIDDPGREAEQIEAENQAADARTRAQFESDPTQPQEPAADDGTGTE